MGDGIGTYYQGQLIEWGPKIGVCLLILLITWIVAQAVKWTLQKAIDRIPALQKQAGSRPGETVGKQLGNIAGLIVWLVGITAALQFLGMGQILTPVSNLTNEIFLFLPRMIGAGLIFFIGLVVARIVRDLAFSLVEASNVGGLFRRAGSVAALESGETAVGSTSVSQESIARATAVTVFAIIIIPVAIASLQALGIDAISRPAVAMLNQILAAIPHIISAALWLGIALLVAGLVRSLLESMLPATGFDSLAGATGILPVGIRPSRVAANIAFAAIMLAAAIEAARQLGGNTVADFLTGITALGARVLFGTAIIAAGVLLGRFVSELAGNGDGGFARSITRYAVIALFSAIGLRFMGLANEIVILAFGLILGAAALATALAFGLGGRRPAEKLLDQLVVRSCNGSSDR